MRLSSFLILASLSLSSIVQARVCLTGFGVDHPFFKNTDYVVRPSASGKLKHIVHSATGSQVRIANTIKQNLYNSKADIISGDRAVIYYENTGGEMAEEAGRQLFAFEVIDLKTEQVLYSSKRLLSRDLLSNPFTKYRPRAEPKYTLPHDERLNDPSYVSGRFYDPERTQLLTIYGGREIEVVDLQTFEMVSRIDIQHALPLESGEWVSSVSSH